MSRKHSRRGSSLIWLSVRDYWNEWQVSICFVLALAAVLGPMLILYGLKAGIIGNMMDQLIHNPRNLEIQTLGTGRYDKLWIEELEKRSDVGFVIPNVKPIAANMDMKAEGGKEIVEVRLIPSAVNDPILGEAGRRLDGMNRVILSSAAAKKLSVKEGGRLDGSIARRYHGRSERKHLALRAAAILPPHLDTRIVAYVPLALAEAVEDFRDGRAVEVFDWKGDQRSPSQPRLYSGFRLYASELSDVRRLAGYLEDIGLRLKTRSEDITVVESMDRNLTMVFWIVALIGLIGFTVSLGASLWANVDRKKRELSMLRLVGFHTGHIIWYPVLQSLMTALLGWLLAVAVYFGVAFLVNEKLGVQMEADQRVCVLEPWHLGVVLGLTLIAAIISAGLAGLKASRIEPADGLRET
ncbi:MAG: ABC transporter permease [Thiotrichales bacterium]